MVQTTQRRFEVHLSILRVLTKTLFITGYSTIATNINLQERVGSVKGRKVLPQRLVLYIQTQWKETAQHNDERLRKWINISDSGQVSDGCKHTPKASSSPRWLLASIP